MLLSGYKRRLFAHCFERTIMCKDPASNNRPERTTLARKAPLHDVVRLSEVGTVAVTALLDKYGIELQFCGDEPLPGSYWGEDEAGLVGNRLYVRSATPLHSLLHEACHFICMDDARRETLHTDAGGDYLEECAVCYLQVVLAERITGYGRDRIFHDMDAWGYSFRLGSARRWFAADADDARAWLEQQQLI